MRGGFPVRAANSARLPGKKRRRRFSRHPGALEEGEKFARPEFVNFALQFAGAVIDWNA